MTHNKNKNGQDKQSLFNKDIRQYIASGIFLLLLFVLIAYLTFIPVPEENSNVILIIIGVLTASAANAIPALFGDSKDDIVESLELRIDKMEKENEILKIKNDVLQTEFERITSMLIERHVIDYSKGSNSVDNHDSDASA